jgi:hypothetical protein
MLTLSSERLTAADEYEAAELLIRTGKTDGLPIVVPTVARVEAMLAATGLDPDVVIGEVGPSDGVATVEKVAINAVMAGCLPDVFPIVLAAVEAVCEPAFGLASVQATTHSLGPIIIVNGPARERCGVQWGVGALGPGHRANATIGRALRLVLLNVGGGAPGLGDMASLGSPAKFTCCLAEAEEDSPFEPLHVSRGWRPDDSVVTVIAGESPHSIFCNFNEVRDPDTFLRIVASSMTAAGTNNIHIRKGMVGLIMNPLHAGAFRQAGLDRAYIQRRLFELAVIRRRDLRAIAGAMVDAGEDDDVLHVVPTPEDFLVFVAGEEGGAYSAWIPTWCGGSFGNVAISKPVRFDDGCDVPVSRIHE